jgi:hypothetical protein
MSKTHISKSGNDIRILPEVVQAMAKEIDELTQTNERLCTLESMVFSMKKEINQLKMSISALITAKLESEDALGETLRSMKDGCVCSHCEDAGCSCLEIECPECGHMSAREVRER